MKKVICHDVEGNETEVDASQLSFRPSVYGILIEDNKVLLLKQWNSFNLPGGGAEIDETIENALKREFFEETGFIVEVLEPIYICTSFFHPPYPEEDKKEYWNCPLMYFAVKKISGELSSENFDDEEKDYACMAEWIDLDKLDEIKFVNSIDIKKIIKKAARLKV